MLQQPLTDFLPISEGFNPEHYYTLDGSFSKQVSRHVPEDDFKNHPFWTSKYLHEKKEVVVKTHEDFLRIGRCDILTTNTYQAHGLKASRINQTPLDRLTEPFDEIQNAVSLADTAILNVHHVPRAALVAGSIGPYGAILADGSEYHGNYVENMSREELKEFHADKIKRLMLGGVDIFAVETIPSVKEALAILDLIKDTANASCWLSFQCKDGEHTAHGEKFDDVVRQCLEHPAFPMKKLKAIGVNCVHPKHVSSLLKLAEKVNRKSNFPKMEGYWRIPYVVYPNNGDVYDSKESKFIAVDEDRGEKAILSRVKEWMLLGTHVIGGCCMVEAETIGKIKDLMLDSLFEVLEKRDDNSIKGKSKDEILAVYMRRTSNKSKKKSSSKEEEDPLDKAFPCKINFKNDSWHRQ